MMGAPCCTGSGRLRQKLCIDSAAGLMKSISTCTASRQAMEH